MPGRSSSRAASPSPSRTAPRTSGAPCSPTGTASARSRLRARSRSRWASLGACSPRCPRPPSSAATARRSPPDAKRSCGLSTISRMLRRLRIENLVLIRKADLELAPGLNAITGETGAGKTILAQAVGLLLGARGDASFIGPGADEAYVEAELDLPDGLLDEDGLEGLGDLRPEDEPGLVVARRIFADGRTRAYAWGRSAAREDMAGAAERLIAMSGQFEQRRLARPAYQLDVLDGFAGDDQLRRRIEARLAWRELSAARRRHEELTAGAESERARLDDLRALV